MSSTLYPPHCPTTHLFLSFYSSLASFTTASKQNPRDYKCSLWSSKLTQPTILSFHVSFNCIFEVLQA
ncbi:hypothetical protein HanRHA438_Chr00c17g0850951 [Helianthus annuus]|nr:hypothetical protein HanRHA438_Chr00c17g0850951 [Helianthus annuus]